MKEFIRKNFLIVIILLLTLVSFYERVSNIILSPIKPEIIRDTIWIHHYSTIETKPTIINNLVPTKPPLIPDTSSVDALKKQFNELALLYQNRNIHFDKIKIDSIGSISITDTVSENQIIGRKLEYSFKYPEITNTITLPYKARRQVYIGGGLQGNPVQIINQFDVKGIYKDRKDRMFGVSVGMDFNGQLQYGVSSYWKIKF